MKSRKVRKKSIRKKIARMLILMSLIIVLIVCIAVMLVVRKQALLIMSKEAYSYATDAGELIRGDKIQEYLTRIRNGDDDITEDEYYGTVQSYLDRMRMRSNMQNLRVFVPRMDDLLYIWDSGEEDTYVASFGTVEAYMPGKKAAVEAALAGKQNENLVVTGEGKYGDVGTLYYPVRNSTGEAVAVVEAVVPMIMIKLLVIILILIAAIIPGVIVLVFSLILFYLLNKSVFRPVLLLNNASKNMVDHLESENSYAIPVKSVDEIGELTQSFNQMYDGVRNYIRELSEITAEKERIGAELDIARHIQASMLPTDFSRFSEEGIIDIYASMHPAKEVGGDFYDFFMVDRTHLAIVAADVSGKGVPAALFMVIGKTLIKNQTLQEKDLGNVFSKVNNLLCESNSEELFITAFEGVLDLETGEFRYVNAGHEKPFLYRQNKSFELYDLPAGFVLAGLENTRYRSGVLHLEPGDRIFQYTDGVTEAHNEQKELYGTERLQAVLNRNINKPARELVEAVAEDVRSFSGKVQQFDDITMLCLDFIRKM